VAIHAFWLVALAAADRMAIADRAVDPRDEVARREADLLLERQGLSIDLVEDGHRDGQLVDALHREAFGLVEPGSVVRLEDLREDADLTAAGLGDRAKLAGERRGGLEDEEEGDHIHRGDHTARIISAL